MILSGEFDKRCCYCLQAENCFDKEVIYSFLDANEIGKTHSDFYISYASHLESKNKFKAANQTFELGIARYCGFLSYILDLVMKFLSFLFHVLICYILYCIPVE